MIITKKILITSGEEDFLMCDNCGEGIGLNTDDKKALDDFEKIHKNCDKPKNKNLKL